MLIRKGCFFMSKFNTVDKRAAARQGPITTAPTPTLTTYEGAPAYQRDTKAELFLLAAGSFALEDSGFYEKEMVRGTRFKNLVVKVAVEDPWWLLGFVGWLRRSGNMRTAPMVAALEGMKAILDAKLPASVVQKGDRDRGVARQLVDWAIARADEPGEALAYWISTYGKKLPKPLKRGIADAAQRTYKQYQLTKYDTPSHAVRFGDVADLVHPKPVNRAQSDLFKHAIDRRHGRGAAELPATLKATASRSGLLAVPVGERRALLAKPDFHQQLAYSNMTWEAVAGWLQGPMDAMAWEAIIPSMPYMALLRNLRNFDEAGISERVRINVQNKLGDVDAIIGSKQFPFRFFNAYRELNSLHWGPVLEKAITVSVSNVPALEGVTRVLVDTSASMTTARLSDKSTTTVAAVAAIFGVALAVRNPGRVHLYGFADGQFEHTVKAGGSILREAERFIARTGEVGHGTRIPDAIKAAYRSGDARVIVISDMQTMQRGATTGVRGYGTLGGMRGWYQPADTVTDSLPATVPLYGFTLNGYQPAAADWGNPNRIELGGLTDATFKLIPLIEAGSTGAYPWMTSAG